jgi:hypothetical protein
MTPPTQATPKIPEPVVDLFVETLRPKPGQLQVDEVTGAFAWAKKHRLWAGYVDETAACVAYDGASPPVLLTGDDLGPLSRVLVAERGALEPYSAHELATAVRRLTRPDPIGYLGDRGVLELPVMRRRAVDDPARATFEAVRAEASEAPRFVAMGGGAKRLEFSYWRKDGGIDAWSVELVPSGFRRAEQRELAPKGSYHYPLC